MIFTKLAGATLLLAAISALIVVCPVILWVLL
jgi:hypothetical protein